MTTEVTSIGVGMETDGVERGIRTLQQLASQGPRVEKSMQGVEAAASKVNKSLSGLGEGSDRGLKSVNEASKEAERGLDGVTKQADNAKRSMDNMARSASNIGASIQTAPVTRGIDSVKTSAIDASKAVDLLKSALAVTGIGIGVKEVIGLADGYTKFTAQLKLATKGADDYAAAMGSVRRISMDAQQGLAETGTLYARIANGTAELGLSQRKLSEITETVALGLKVSGATANESASAMLQLSQAFASGVLRGEEFNAVNEAAPRIMKALADGIGVPVGALREMASEGKITSQVMADALPKALAQIRKEAEQIQTIGGSFTVLKNNLLEFVGAGDKASGATKLISTAVTGLASNLDVAAAAAGGLAIIMGGRYIGALTTAAAASSANAVATTAASRAALAGSTSYLVMSNAATSASFGVTALATASKVASGVLAAFGGPVGLLVTGLGAAAAAFLYFRDTSEEAIKSIGGLQQPLDDLKKKLDALPAEKRISVVMDIGKQQVDAIDDAEQSLNKLKDAVAVIMHQRFPNDEVQAFRERLESASKSGENMVPILQDAARSAAIRPEVLNHWIQLAANFRTAQGEAAALKSTMDSLKTGGVGGGRGVVNPQTIGQMNAAANAEAAAVLKATSSYKSKAEQMAETRAQGEKLRTALNGLITTNQGTSKSADDLRARIAGVDERLASMGKSGRAAADGSKKVESAYTTLSKRVGDYIEQLRIEALQGDKATAAQKAQIQLNDILANSKSKVTAAKVASLQADIQTALLMENEAKATKLAADQAEEAAKAYDAVLESAEKRADALRKQIQTEEQATAAIGLSKDAIAALESAKYEDLAVSKELAATTWQSIDLSGEMTKKLKEEAQGYRDLASARIQRGIKQANYDTAKQAEKDWEKVSENVGRTLSDYIMGGGKDAAQYLKRLFSTLVLQPIVNIGVQSLMGGSGQGVLGAAGNITGIFKDGMDIASMGKNIYSAITGGFQTLSGTVSTYLQSGINMLSGSGGIISQGPIQVGGFAQGAGAAAGAAAGVAGGVYGGRFVSGGYSAFGGSSGNSAVNTGTAIGAAVGSIFPVIGTAIGALVGGLLGGAVNRLFGHKLKDSGIEGNFGGDTGFEGNTYEFYKGGLFSSDKTKRSTLDEGLRSGLAENYQSIKGGIKGLGESLGLITSSVDAATYSIKLSLKGLSEEESTKAIQAEFDRIAESMAGLILVTNEYSLADEKRLETLTRLSGSLNAFNSSLDLLGVTAYEASLKSADAAYKIISAFGGLENYGQALQSYYQNFYSEAEQLAKITETVTNALGQYGAKLPETAEAYRAMVEAQLLAAQYGDDKATEFAAALIGMSGNFKLISDAWKKELDGMADSIANVFSGIKDEIASVLSDVAGTRKDILRGTGVMTAAEIQAAINAALVYAPSTAGIARAQGATSLAASSVASARSTSDRSAAEYAARIGAVNSAGANLAFGEAQKTALEKQARELTDWINSLWDGGANSGYSYGKRKKWSDDAAAQLEEVNRAISAMNPNLAKMREEVARQQAIADQAGKVSQADADRLAAAKAALDAAQKDEVKAKAEYASQLNKFVQDASGSVSKLSDLRGEVVSFYESQVQAVEAMLQSAGNLRNVVDTVRLGQLNTAQTARELGNRYALDYSMALATNGTTRAGYVDALAGNLKGLTDAIKVEAVSSSDWQIQTAKLLAQATNAAGLLEGDAKTDDYQDIALGLLDSIDAALKSLESATKSGEQIIADAVNNGTASMLTGLRAVIAALKGEPIPAFAIGTNYVPRDMVAQIHEGEAIVPKAFNPWAGGGMPSGGGSSNKEMESLMRQLISEQRTQASRMVELQIQMNKRQDRWDAMGMPEVREV